MEDPNKPLGAPQHSSDSPPENTTNVPSNKKLNWKLFFVAIVVIGLLDWGAITLLQSENNQKLVPPTPIQSRPTAPTISPATDPTADWKIYNNTKYNYSIKYPTAMLFEGNTTSEFVTLDKQITISVSSRDPKDCRGDCNVEDNEATKDIRINNNTAYITKGYIGQIGGNIPQNYQQVVFPHNNLFYIFTLYELKNNSEEPFDRELKPISPNNLAIFNQILSTVNFTNNQIQPTRVTECTDEARQCPDGSYVGRSGPKCEFVCPKPN